MDIDSPSSDESSQSDTSFSSTEESLNDSFEENEKDEGDTNNNEDVEAVPKSSTSSHVHEKSSDNNEGIETTNKDKELSWNDTKLFPPDKSRSNVWKFGGFIKDDKGKLVKEKVIKPEATVEQSHCGESLALIVSLPVFCNLLLSF